MVAGNRDNQTYMLNKTSHAGLRDSTTAENLNGIACSILGAPRGMHLQQADRSAVDMVKINEASRQPMTYPASFEACSLYDMLFIW